MDKCVYKRDFTDENRAIFTRFLALENWVLGVSFNADSVCLKSNIFMGTLIPNFNSSFPLRRKHQRGNKVNKAPLSEHNKCVKEELRVLRELISIIKDSEDNKSSENNLIPKRIISPLYKNDVRKANEHKIIIPQTKTEQCEM
jgi:hypothetical protein